MSAQASISYELIRLMGETPDIQTILDIGYKYLNNPIHLTDLTGRLLATSCRDCPVDDIWDGIEQKGYIDYDLYQSTCLPNVLQIIKSSRPFIIRDAPGHVTLLVCGLKTPGHFCANLICIENQRPVTSEDEGILSLIATSLAVILDRFFPDTGRKIDICDYLICDLLDTPKVDLKMLRERQKIVDLKIKPPMQILTICTTKNRTALPTLNVTRRLAQEQFTGCKTVLHNNRTVTLLNGSPLDRDAFLCSPIFGHLQKNNLTAALSRPFEKLEDIYTYYMQTLYALEFGAIIDPKHCFYCYDDYAVYHCLRDCHGQNSLKHPCIRLLSEYDGKHHTDYVRTLYAYTRHLRSMKDAAAAMNIHYNTMKYRMKHIRELMDIDIEDPDTFLMLYLSFKTLEMEGNIFRGENSYENAADTGIRQ